MARPARAGRRASRVPRPTNVPHEVMTTPTALSITCLLLLLLTAWLRARHASSVRSARLCSRSTWVLITGAGSGIGRDAALQWAALGASVALWDINGDSATRVAAECKSLGRGGDVIPTTVDVSDEGAVARAAIALTGLTADGVVDVVISNAGTACAKDVDAMSAGDVMRSLGVNLCAPFSLLRALLPAQKRARRGTWVFTASTMGLVGAARLSDYCASKAGLMGLAESLRMELARDGLQHDISVITIAPYVVDTRMFEGIFCDPRDFNPVRGLFPILRSTDVAASMVTAACAGGNAVLVLPASVGIIVYAIKLLLPLSVYDLIVGWMGGWHGMSSFGSTPSSSGTAGGGRLEGARGRRRGDKQL